MWNEMKNLKMNLLKWIILSTAFILNLFSKYIFLLTIIELRIVYSLWAELVSVIISNMIIIWDIKIETPNKNENIL